jgi:hypothetical protein
MIGEANVFHATTVTPIKLPDLFRTIIFGPTTKLHNGVFLLGLITVKPSDLLLARRAQPQ